MRTAAIMLGLACGACASEDAPRGAPQAPQTLASCTGIVGRWLEVEPVDGTTVDEPKDGKVRPISPGTQLTFEPHRLTIASAVERSESSLVIERAGTGACLIHARDSKGRPLDVEAAFATDRLLRLHNVAEPRSPWALYERQ